MQTVEVKGWRYGLMIVVPPEGEWDEIIERMHERLDEARARSFWRGSQTTFDCGSRVVTQDELKAMTDRIRRGFGLIPTAVISTQAETRAAGEALGLEIYEETPTFKKPTRAGGERTEPEKPASADGPVPAETVPPPTEQRPVANSTPPPTPEPRSPIPESPPAEKRIGEIRNNALYLTGTVRSGQRVTHDTHLVICGDVNAGGEVVAGGDIVVVGTLRGLAHAGCYGDESARIIAGSLRPHQLRIAAKIARAPEESDRPAGSRGESARPEVARIEGGEIGVFPL